MKLKKVINLFGGPGSGKSTLALSLTSKMKKMGISVELVPEYAKQMVLENRLDVLKYDQLYVFAKQHRKILTLGNTVEYIITDSPFVQGITYLSDDSVYDRDSFTTLALTTHKKYPCYNVFMIRADNIKYEEMGRYQNEEEADIQSNKIREFLDHHQITYQPFFTGSGFEKVLIQEITKNNTTM